MSEVFDDVGRPQKPAKSLTVTKRASKCTASRVRFDKLASRRVISNKNDNFIELAYAGKLKLLEDLLRKGQPVDALHSYTQTTALSAAIDRGHYATARTLLKWKADPNYRHPVTGETPLHRAAARGDPRIVKCLLENNPRADRHIISVANQKPMTIAREYQWLEVSDILREPPSQPLVINVEVTPSTALFTWNIRPTTCVGRVYSDGSRTRGCLSCISLPASPCFMGKCRLPLSQAIEELDT